MERQSSHSFIMNLTIENFPHKPPEGYWYEIKPFKRNVLSIWLHHPNRYNYTDDPVATIWGFYNTKKSQYYAPRNAKSVGDPVDINDTRDYTAMQLNLGPLAGILC